MNVVPKRFFYNGALKYAFTNDGGKTVIIECEVVSPPSRKGQTVRVFFSPQDVTDVLLLMRDAAVRARM